MTGCCYMVRCKECDPGDTDPKERSRYIGQSGCTLHRRQKSHLQGIKGKRVLAKHLKENHPNQQVPNDPSALFSMIPVRTSRTVVDRLVREGVYIQEMEETNKGFLMNSRGGVGERENHQI